MSRRKTSKRSMKKKTTQRSQKKYRRKSRKYLKGGNGEPCLAAYLAKYHKDDGSMYHDLRQQFKFSSYRQQWEKENPGYTEFIKKECK